MLDEGASEHSRRYAMRNAAIDPVNGRLCGPRGRRRRVSGGADGH